MYVLKIKVLFKDYIAHRKLRCPTNVASIALNILQQSLRFVFFVRVSISIVVSDKEQIGKVELFLSILYSLPSQYPIDFANAVQVLRCYTAMKQKQ